MDAVKFLYEIGRMHKSHCSDCAECKLYGRATETRELCGEYVKNHPDEAVAIVEQWAKEHPRKTRQSELLKMFPNVGRGDDGLIAFCPEDFDSKFECPPKSGGGHDQCGECRKKYWLEEVEDDGD